MLACAGPLVLCIVVLSAAFFPAIWPAETNETPETNNMSFGEDRLVGGISAGYTKAQIYGAGERTVTDQKELTYLLNTIYALWRGDCSATPEAAEQLPGGDGLLGGNIKEEPPTVYGGVKECYTIVFCAADDSQLVYTLEGNTLLNVHSGEKRELSASQLLDLKSLLKGGS